MASDRRALNRKMRQRAILDLARDQFFERGYAAVTMSQIAAALGGSKGTLWAYFPSKDALFSAVVADAAAQLHADMKNILAVGSDFANNLHAFASRFNQKLTSPPSIQLQRLILSEAQRFPQLGRIFYERAFVPVLRGLSRYFTAESALGIVYFAEPDQAAFELISLLQRPQQFHLWLLEESLGSEPAASIYLHAAVDTFTRAYQRPSAKPLNERCSKNDEYLPMLSAISPLYLPEPDGGGER